MHDRHDDRRRRLDVRTDARAGFGSPVGCSLARGVRRRALGIGGTERFGVGGPVGFCPGCVSVGTCCVRVCTDRLGSARRLGRARYVVSATTLDAAERLAGPPPPSARGKSQLRAPR